MKEKFNEATPQRPKGDRQLDAPLVIIDLQSIMDQIDQEPSWQDSDRNAVTVYKTNGLRIVLIALHAGAEMVTHTAEGIISVQVIEGKITFKTDQQSVELGKLQMVTLHEGIPHSVSAIEDTRFLLTLTTRDKTANRPEGGARIGE